MKKTLLLALFSALLLTSCGEKDVSVATPVPTPTPAPTAAPTPTPTATPDPAPHWIDQSSDKSYTAADGTVVMTTKNVFPDLSDWETNPAWSAIHTYYEAQLTAAIEAAEETSAWALDGYTTAQASDYDFHPYAQEYSYEMAYDSEALVSIRRAGYSFTGGAHPFGSLLSETFDMETGAILTLDDLFVDGYQESLMTTLQTVHADSEYAEYVEADALATSFDLAGFYLTADSLVLYYSEGILGPHALGTPTYTIPKTDLTAIQAIAW